MRDDPGRSPHPDGHTFLVLADTHEVIVITERFDYGGFDIFHGRFLLPGWLVACFPPWLTDP